MPSITRSTRRGAPVLALAVLGAAGCGMPSGPLDICSGTSDQVARLEITPTEFNLRVGSSATLQLGMYDAKGQGFYMCGPPVEWSSTDRSVATVTGGSVLGISPGKVFIRATAGGKSDSTSVTVVATTIGSISIQRAPASLLVGQTVGLMLVTRDTDGNIITPQSITWRTDDATVATIAPSGMLIAVSEGTTTVTVEAEQLTTSVRIPITRDAPAVRFRQIAAGFYFGCGIAGGGRFPEGTAFCWGDGSTGALGIGQLGYAAVPFPVSGGLTFKSIAVGDFSACALTVAGEAYCWGSNESAQLGDGTTTNRPVPTRVVTTVAFKSLALGGSLTCGLTDDGSVYCWGQVGATRRTAPTLLPGGIQFADLTGGGGGFICGRTSAGRAYCWGTSNTWAGPTPTAAKGDVLFAQISAGVYHVCGVAITDGRGYCWGRIDGQQLGPSIAPGSRDTPIAVPGGLQFTSIAAGGGFTCGTTATRSYCLGVSALSNAAGTDPSPRPIPLEDRHRFVTIAGGSFHACAIDTQGGGWCWGHSLYGSVGAGEANFGQTDPLQLRIQ